MYWTYLIEDKDKLTEHCSISSLISVKTVVQRGRNIKMAQEKTLSEASNVKKIIKVHQILYKSHVTCQTFY